MAKHLTPDQKEGLLNTLKVRFKKNESRHRGIEWEAVMEKLEKQPAKLWSLYQMEETGGEPDVIGYDEMHDAYLFCDCSAESPKGRRSLCYDAEALEARKEHKPLNSAVYMAEQMGITLLNEQQYRDLQKWGPFDSKTSSWIETPKEIRKLDGALFGDFRYNQCFIYHNGASSYYAARGFRGLLKL